MPLIRKRTMILSFLFFVGSFVYYGLSLNQSSVGGDQNQFLTFTLYGVMEIPALLFAMLGLSYFGRRLPTVLLYSSAGKGHFFLNNRCFFYQTKQNKAIYTFFTDFFM